MQWPCALQKKRKRLSQDVLSLHKVPLRQKLQAKLSSKDNRRLSQNNAQTGQELPRRKNIKSQWGKGSAEGSAFRIGRKTASVRDYVVASLQN